MQVKKLIQFNRIGGGYIKRAGEKNKLTHAIERVAKKELVKIFEEYNDAVEDAAVEHCMTYAEGEKKGAIMSDEKGNYMFSKEGSRLKKKAVEKAAEKEVTIEGYMATIIPDDLTDDEIEAFEGIVIPMGFAYPVANLTPVE